MRGPFSTPITPLTGSFFHADPHLRQLADRVTSGKLSSESALRASEGIDFTGLKISRSEFQKAIIDAASAAAKDQTAKLVDESLDGGKLAAGLKQDDKKKGPKDRTDQREERFDDQIARLKGEQATILLGLTSDLRERADIERQQVQAEFDAYKADLDHQVAQKEITAERGKQLLAEKARTKALQDSVIDRDLARDLAKEQFDLESAGNRNAQDIVSSQAGLAKTAAERRKLELRLLELQFSQEEAQQQLIKATNAIGSAAYRNAEARLSILGELKGSAQEGVRRSTAGPAEAYITGIYKTAGEEAEAFEQAAVDGLKSVEDQLTSTVTGVLKLGGVFGSVANSIVSDLIRIAVQKNITGPLAGALFGGGGGGLLGSIGGALGLAGGFGSNSAIAGESAGVSAHLSTLKIPGLATGGSFQIGGRGGIDRNLLSLNGLPVARVSKGEMVSVAPPGSNDNGRGGPVHFHLEGAVLTQDLVNQMNAIGQASQIGAVGAVEQRAGRRARSRL